MKRTRMWLLAGLCMVLPLAGCAAQENDAQTSTAVSTEASTEAGTEASTEASTETSTEAGTEASTEVTTEADAQPGEDPGAQPPAEEWSGNIDVDRNGDLESFDGEFHFTEKGWTDYQYYANDNSLENSVIVEEDGNHVLKLYTANGKRTTITKKLNMSIAETGSYKLSMRVKGGPAFYTDNLDFRIDDANGAGKHFPQTPIDTSGIRTDEWTTLEVPFEVASRSSSNWLNLTIGVNTRADEAAHQSADNYLLMDDIQIMKFGVAAGGETSGAGADSKSASSGEGEAMVNYLKTLNVGSVISVYDPEGQYNLSDVKNVHMIDMLTGEYSPNKTMSQYGIGGTDLGVMINKGDETFFFFGDTFEDEVEQVGNWRCNTAAVTSDADYTDGIIFDRMISDEKGAAGPARRN